MENQNEYIIGTIDKEGFHEVPDWAKEIATKIYDVTKKVEQEKDNDVDLSDGL